MVREEIGVTREVGKEGVSHYRDSLIPEQTSMTVIRRSQQQLLLVVALIAGAIPPYLSKEKCALVQQGVDHLRGGGAWKPLLPHLKAHKPRRLSGDLSSQH